VLRAAGDCPIRVHPGVDRRDTVAGSTPGHEPGSASGRSIRRQTAPKSSSTTWTPGISLRYRRCTTSNVDLSVTNSSLCVAWAAFSLAKSLRNDVFC